MRAPHRWSRTALAVATTALASACGETAGRLTAPDALDRSPTALPRPALEDSAAASVIVHRTTTRYRPGSGVKLASTQQSWRFPRGVAPSLDATAILPFRRDSSPSPEAFRKMLPLSVVRVHAALTGVACTNGRPWERTTVAGRAKYVTRGRGSVPYAEVEMFIDGQAVGTLKAQWRRLSRSWVLASQEFTSADGTTRDVLRLEHFDASGDAEHRAVPQSPCNEDEAPSALSPFASQTSLALVPRSPFQPPAMSTCEPTDEELEAGACYQETLAMIAASGTYAAASAAVWTTCGFPEPVLTKVACVSAIAAYNAASMAVGIAYDKLRVCKEKARLEMQKVCSCNAARKMPTGRSELTKPGHGDKPSRPERPNPSSLCDGSLGDGGTTSSGGGDYTGSTDGPVYYEVLWCTLVDYYDSQGNYLYTVNQGCWTEIMVM